MRPSSDGIVGAADFRLRETEIAEIETQPDDEREEVRAVYAAKVSRYSSWRMLFPRSPLIAKPG
jgi:hypothetical protein